MKTFILCLLLVAAAIAAPSRRPQFERGYNKIVGGHPVAPGDIPYIVSLQEIKWSGTFHFCGGSVYSPDWIISAGHCVTKDDIDLDNPDNVQVVAAGLYLFADEDITQRVNVSKIIVHEEFSRNEFENDISVLQLSSPLTFNEYVQPIAIPRQGQNSTGSAVVSGWGLDSWGGWTTDYLYAVTVPIVSDEECREMYGDGYTIFDYMICAGEEGLDSCKGDSGGPMTCTSGDSTYLCGIVSWGYGCAWERKPGVYTEVSYFVDWIHANTGVIM